MLDGVRIEEICPCCLASAIVRERVTFLPFVVLVLLGCFFSPNFFPD